MQKKMNMLKLILTFSCKCRRCSWIPWGTKSAQVLLMGVDSISSSPAIKP